MEEELITTERSMGAPSRHVGCDFCIHEPTFWHKYGVIIQYCIAPLLRTLIIGFLITLGFYLVYKHKKDEHPWRHAIKRSWPWWIAVFLIPFVVLGILYIILV